MAGSLCVYSSQSLTANGDTFATGYVSVTDASQYQVSAQVTLIGTTAPAVGYEVVLVDTTNNVVGLRLTYLGIPRLNGQNYGLSPTSAYTTADGAKLIQNVQFIYAGENVVAAGGSSVTIGSFGGTSAAGLSLSGSALSLNAASATTPGGVSTGTQTFAGDKLFSGTLGTVSGDITAGGDLKTTNGGIRGMNYMISGPSTGVEWDLQVPDSPTAVALQIHTTNILTTGGAKLLSIDNHGTERFSIIPDGTTTASGTFVSLTSGFQGNFLHRQNATTMDIAGGPGDGATAVAVAIGSSVAYPTAGAKIVSFRNGGAEFANFNWNADGVHHLDVTGGYITCGFAALGNLAVNGAGIQAQAIFIVGERFSMTYFDDTSGTPGNATSPKTCGRSAFSAATSTVVITNSNCRLGDIVQCQLETVDATCKSLIAVAANGHFTVTAGATTTGVTKFSWILVRTAP